MHEKQEHLKYFCVASLCKILILCILILLTVLCVHTYLETIQNAFL